MGTVNYDKESNNRTESYDYGNMGPSQSKKLGMVSYNIQEN